MAGQGSTGGGRSARVRAARRRRRAQLRQRSVLGVILLVIVAMVGFGVLFGIHTVGSAVRPNGSGSAFYTPRVAVVGVADRSVPTAVDAEVLKANEHQAGAVLTGGRCPASGWATLSAGHPVEVSCDIRVTDLGVVEDWADRQAEAARSGGTLGALAAAGQECISAVGPGAALAAARPDGTVADYLDVDAFVAAQHNTACPVTIIDAGDRTDEVVAALAALDDWTVVVTGVGGTPQAQPIYRLATTLPGWLTATSTDRTGIVTLADLSRTLRAVVAGQDAVSAPGVLQVVENGGVSSNRLAEHVAQTNRLVSPPYGPIAVLALLFALGAFVGGGLWWQERRSRRPGTAAEDVDPDDLEVGSAQGNAVTTSLAALALLAAMLPAGLLAAGAVGWWRTGGPEASLVGSVVVIWIITAAVAWLAARVVASRTSGGAPDPADIRRHLPTAAAVVTFTIHLGDAALGGFLHRSSLLAPRPMTQFQGFGGAAMAVLVVSGLVLLAVVSAPWWRRGQPAKASSSPTKRRQPPMPYAVLWRPITMAAVLVALVLGIVWAARPPTAGDVLGFVIAAMWCSATGWMLVRATSPAAPTATTDAASAGEAGAATRAGRR